jgi:hypothetical protein
MGHCLNIQGSMAKSHLLINVHMMLISFDLSCLKDLYRFDKHQQKEILKDIILKIIEMSGKKFETAICAGY